MAKKITKKQEPFVRLNTRIRKDQHKIIKDISSASEKSEGQVFRDVIDTSKLVINHIKKNG